MRKTILILTMFCYAIAGMAQDIIILRDGDEIRSIVQEVGLSEVKYKKYENLTGPVYIVLKKDIFMIKYQNGTKDLFESISDVNVIVSTNAENIPDLNSLKNTFYSIETNDTEMLKFLKEYDVSQQYYHSFNKACAKANSARSARTAGIILSFVGTGVFVGGPWFVDSVAPGVFMIGGCAVAILGEVYLISGIANGAVAGARKSRIKGIYAEQAFGIKLAENQITPQLNFGFTQNGIGLTLNF